MWLTSVEQTNLPKQIILAFVFFKHSDLPQLSPPRVVYLPHCTYVCVQSATALTCTCQYLLLFKFIYQNLRQKVVQQEIAFIQDIERKYTPLNLISPKLPNKLYLFKFSSISINLTCVTLCPKIVYLCKTHILNHHQF